MGQSRPNAHSNIVACWPPIHRGCWTNPERVQIERIRYWCDKCPKLEFDGGQTDEGDRGASFTTASVSRSSYTSRGLAADT
jgi:hypothetical protein